MIMQCLESPQQRRFVLSRWQAHIRRSSRECTLTPERKDLYHREHIFCSVECISSTTEATNNRAEATTTNEWVLVSVTHLQRHFPPEAYT